MRYMPTKTRKRTSRTTTTKPKRATTSKGKPTTMKAAAIDRFGPPEVLTLHSLPVPKVGPKDVLIALHSAGVGIWDADARKGAFSEGRDNFPLVLGADGAGTVAGVGKDVRRFKKGDAVWAYSFGGAKGGFYAEYVVVNVKNVASAPRELSPLEAGAGAVTGLTALQGVDDKLKLRATDTILVFGATGAVGTLAAQFARRTGAHVVATASSGRGAKMLHDLGIADVLDPRAADAADRLRSFAPDGLTAVLAFAGGEDLEKCINQLGAGGRVAYPNGVKPEPRKRAKIKTIPYDAEVGRDEFERLDRAVIEAKLRVIIEKTFKLEDAAQAHILLEQGHIVGRIVLEIR
jgi:NADPH2:quinone reductase